MATTKVTLLIDVDVILDDPNDPDTSWLADEVVGQTGELLVGGYSFAVTGIEITEEK